MHLVFVSLHTGLLSLWFMIQKCLKVFPNSYRCPEKQRGFRDLRTDEIATFKVLKECSVPYESPPGTDRKTMPDSIPTSSRAWAPFSGRPSYGTVIGTSSWTWVPFSGRRSYSTVISTHTLPLFRKQVSAESKLTLGKESLRKTQATKDHSMHNRVT